MGGEVEHLAEVKVKATFRSQVHREGVTFTVAISSPALSRRDASARALHVQPQPGRWEEGAWDQGAASGWQEWPGALLAAASCVILTNNPCHVPFVTAAFPTPLKRHAAKDELDACAAL